MSFLSNLTDYADNIKNAWQYLQGNATEQTSTEESLTQTSTDESGDWSDAVAGQVNKVTSKLDWGTAGLNNQTMMFGAVIVFIILFGKKIFK